MSIAVKNMNKASIQAKRYSNKQTKEKPFNILALVEAAFLFSIIISYDYLWGEGIRFSDSPLHPFWAVIILCLVQYSLIEGLLVSVLAGFFLLAGNMPVRSILETSYDYYIRVLQLPLSWFLAALVIGLLRARQLAHLEFLREQNETYQGEIIAMSKAVTVLSEKSTLLEAKIIEEAFSLPRVFELAKKINGNSNENTTDIVTEIICSSVKATKFSLYLACPDGINLRFCYGWDEKEEQSRTKIYPYHHDITQAVVDQRRLLNLSDEQDTLLLKGEGLLAGPIVNVETGEACGMLKVESCELIISDPQTSFLFKNACDWVSILLTKKIAAKEITNSQDTGLIYLRNEANAKIAS